MVMSDVVRMHRHVIVKVTTGVCEAHLLQVYKPCVIGAIPTKTYCDWIAPMTEGLYTWWR